MSNSGTIGKKITIKKIFTIVGIIFGVVLALVCAYVAYVFSYYHRLPDNQVVEVVAPVDSNAEIFEKVSTGKELTIVTYNVGFGAYSPDFSFFMDGGKSSWAKSKESAAKLITGAGELSLSFEPDFVLLQEIDIDSTRTYHLNELEIFRNQFSGYTNTFAVNYDSAFFLYPFNEPHGTCNAGLAMFSRYNITSSLRRSLPVSDDFNRILDMDRCYTINRIPTTDGKELVIINIHMSAYGSTPAVREGQTAMLREDMEKEYAAGNYVIVGGDYNHNLKIKNDDGNMGWAKAYERTLLPEGFTFVIDLLDEQEMYEMHNSCRDAGKPYSAMDPTVTLDGFIISDNVRYVEYFNYDGGYAYSDHDPVVMKFVLEQK